MPNEFSGLERVAGKVSNIASKVKGWVESISWDAPSEFGRDNPFKGIKNFEELNKSYLEIRQKYGQTQLSLVNMFYSSQREIIIKNFIALLKKMQAEYADVNQKKQELKMTDASIKMSEKQFKKEFPNYTAPTAPEAKKETAEEKAVVDRLKELDNDLKQILVTLGIYKQYSLSDTYIKNKPQFITELLASLNDSLTKQSEKTRLFKQEVETGKQLPKKPKESTTVKQGDSSLNLNDKKTLRIKIKSK